jgi:microcystin-dependent protein
MGTPFIGEIKIVSFDFAPQGWARCNGQLLPINQNQALFSLLGTTYGGNGQTTFALPNLQGRVPLHWGGGWNLGDAAGQESHTLTIAETPQHVHVVQAGPASSRVTAVSGHALASASTQVYKELQRPAALPANTVRNVGGSQPHENMQPYLVLNFMIALVGVFPVRS